MGWWLWWLSFLWWLWWWWLWLVALVALPCQEIGSSDPDLSDSDWDGSDFQFILSIPWNFWSSKPVFEKVHAEGSRLRRLLYQGLNPSGTLRYLNMP